MSVPTDQMQGLLGGAQAPTPAPSPAPTAAPAPAPGGAPAPAPAPGAEQQQGGPMDPQVLERQFNKVAQFASKVLYDEKVFDQLIEAASKDPVPALSITVVRIMSKVDEKFPGLSIDVMFSVGMALIVDAADAIQQSGVEVTEQHVTLALQDAIQNFLTQNPDRFSQQELRDGIQRLREGISQLEEPAPTGAEQEPTDKEQMKRGML